MKCFEKIEVGVRNFGNSIDITDPCYNSDVECRINGVKIVPGEYKCYIWFDPDDKTVGAIGMSLDGTMPSFAEMQKIGYIGVDAGLAGFFENKPDFTDKEWEDFCNSIIWNKTVFFVDTGFFSTSGYGDGSYPVYASKSSNGAYDALKIKFI